MFRLPREIWLIGTALVGAFLTILLLKSAHTLETLLACGIIWIGVGLLYVVAAYLHRQSLRGLMYGALLKLVTVPILALGAYFLLHPAKVPFIATVIIALLSLQLLYTVLLLS